MKRVNVLLIAILMLLALAGGASAWGKSVNIAAVDDQGAAYCNSDWPGSVVCSPEMGGVYPASIAAAGMTGTMTRVEPADVNAVILNTYDTLLLFNCDPARFSSGQKADIVAFVKDGGKLVIWDSEDQFYSGTAPWDYGWLPTTFSEAVPGAQGAAGNLVIKENNQLSSNNPSDPFYIDVAQLMEPSDAVGDANVMTKFIGSQWCTDMEATNVLPTTGPVHAYTKNLPATVDKGIIIFDGLDWDDAGYGYNGPGKLMLEKLMAFEFNADNLPCNFKPTEYFVVTKTADKTQYNVGDDIVFDLSVLNPGQLTSEDTTAEDFPPAEVTCSVTTADIGDLAPGNDESAKLTCKAVAEGCGLTNSVIVTGNVEGVPVLTGSATSAPFNIGSCPGPVSAPEFPTLALPIGMIIGIVFIVYSVKRKD